MTTKKQPPLLRALPSARDDELRRLAIYGTNAELAAAIARLKFRGELRAVEPAPRRAPRRP